MNEKFLYNADGVDHTPTTFVAKDFQANTQESFFEQAVEEHLDKGERLLQLKDLAIDVTLYCGDDSCNCTDGNAEWFANQVQVSVKIYLQTSSIWKMYRFHLA